MIQHPAFTVEPWAVRETELHLDALAQTESVLALANGHIGLRGNLDEGEPYGLPGTYLNGFYELRPLPYAEAGYGNPESGQTVVNVTNGKIIRLLVDDEPFDVRYGELRKHERVLDLRAGVLRRTAEWVSPTGRPVRVSTTRLVSFSQRAIAAICYEVEPLDGQTRLVVQSELVTNEQMPLTGNDPRAAAALGAALQSEFYGHFERGAVLVHSTSASGLKMAAAMDHVIDGPDAPGRVLGELRRSRAPDRGRRRAPGTAAARCQVSELRVVAPSARSTRSAIRSARRWPRRATRAGMGCSRSSARTSTISGIAPTSRSRVMPSCSRRFASRLFHLLQAGARAERRAIAAKGLTGPGYDGHTFWDTETFVLPVLTYTAPHAVARCAALAPLHARSRPRPRASSWGSRARRSPGGRSTARSARGTGLRGRRRSTTTPPSPTPSSAIRRPAKMRSSRSGVGLELLVETARMWRSLGHHDAAGTLPDRRRDRPRRVQRDRRQQRLHEPDGRAEPARGFPRRRALSSSARGRARASIREESAAWRDAAKAMLIPYDEERGVHPQAEAFTEHEVWDFDAHRRRTSIRCCCTSPTSSSIASRSSSRPTWCSPCISAATPSPTSRRRATSPTTKR